MSILEKETPLEIQPEEKLELPECEGIEIVGDPSHLPLSLVLHLPHRQVNYELLNADDFDSRMALMAENKPSTSRINSMRDILRQLFNYHHISQSNDLLLAVTEELTNIATRSTDETINLTINRNGSVTFECPSLEASNRQIETDLDRAKNHSTPKMGVHGRGSGLIADLTNYQFDKQGNLTLAPKDSNR